MILALRILYFEEGMTEYGKAQEAAGSSRRLASC
jgi:hypothetical protein